jgi:sialic acid synthase SpsE
MDRALEMVRSAARSGADFVKFQSYDEDDLSPEVDASTREWVRRVQLSEACHRRLLAEAQAAGISFLSTPVNVHWANFLCDLGLSAVKLASLSLTDEPLLRFAGESFEEVFLSTGMGDVDEIESAVEVVGDRARVTLLHCVSEYPTPDGDASLLSIPFLRERFNRDVGYSDHTIGTTACLAACALGAELIEKHVTLDKTLEGTDHICSADPVEMTEIVQGCRRIGRMMGIRGKTPAPGEVANRNVMRSLFVAR